MLLVYFLLSICIILCLLESAMFFLVHNPELLRRFSRKLQNSISYLFIQGERKVMQFQEGCGRYDPELGYTLKPGRFIFTELEYSNEYRINTMGLRDSEESLKKPEIIVVGDSYALGWGVDQWMIFSKQLEARIQRKTLNVSVPSYGTVREMLMLRKLDRSVLKCLIIQYCSDDHDENLRFYINGNKPQIMREETFQYLSTSLRRSAYFPGKYVLLKIRKKAGEWKSKPTKSAENNLMNEVDLFIHVLKQNADMLDSIPIIVFEMNGINQINAFTLGLKEITSDQNQPCFIRNMIILDMSQSLVTEIFMYLMDI